MKLHYDNVQVDSYQDWWDVFTKNKPDSWEEGRSAESLARFWTDPDMANEFKRWIAVYFNQKDVNLNNGHIEHVTKFDSARSYDQKGNREHDLLFNNAEFIVDRIRFTLSIEAKGDEPLADLNSEQIRNISSSSNKRKRLENIHKIIRPKSISMEEDEAFLRLRYQFFSAIAGTLTEAKKSGNEQAILVIHTFSTNKTISKNKERNTDDIIRFLRYIGYNVRSGKGFENKIYGPIGLNPPKRTNDFETYYDNGVKLYIGFYSTDFRILTQI